MRLSSYSLCVCVCVKSEQKRFLQQHKQRSETYSKAAATMKKHRKKHKSTKTGLAMDKELKVLIRIVVKHFILYLVFFHCLNVYLV